MRVKPGQAKEPPRFAIHDLLKGEGRTFSNKQQILVTFLYRNYQKVAFMNITELARETKVSEATIVRLANLLGFDGYPPLQKAVQRILAQELTTLERMQLSVEQHELDHPMQRVVKTDIRNLMRTYQHLSAAETDRVTACILRARKIAVVGVMASAPLALYFGYALNRILRNVDTFTDAGVSTSRAVFESTRKDLLIAFAFPRYPGAVVDLLRNAKANRVPSLGFTDSGVSPLAELTDPCVFLPFELLGFVDSLAAPLSFVAGLVAEIGKREPRRTAQALKDFEKMARELKLFHRLSGGGS